MSKRKLVAIGVISWIAFHGLIFLSGAVFGGGLEALTHFGQESGEKEIHCQEDEVALHGGLDDWYDPDLPLECVNFEEFPELFSPPIPVIGKAWVMASAPTYTPTPAPTPQPTPITTPVPTPASIAGQNIQIALSFYTCPPFCLGDTMANGNGVHEGAVACGYGLETGQRFSFRGVEYVCEDRGAPSNPVYWVDFWLPNHEVGYAWQAEVGMSGVITLIP